MVYGTVGCVIRCADVADGVLSVACKQSNPVMFDARIAMEPLAATSVFSYADVFTRSLARSLGHSLICFCPAIHFVFVLIFFFVFTTLVVLLR